jgi:hypothetical protein
LISPGRFFQREKAIREELPFLNDSASGNSRLFAES